MALQTIVQNKTSRYGLDLKFMFSKKATKIDEIFTIDLTLTTYCQINGEDFVNFCGLLRKLKLYEAHFLARFDYNV